MILLGSFLTVDAGGKMSAPVLSRNAGMRPER